MSHLLSTFEAKHSHKSRNINMSMRKCKQRLEKQEQLPADMRSNLPSRKTKQSKTKLFWSYSYQDERNSRSEKGLANESVLLNTFDL